MTGSPCKYVWLLIRLQRVASINLYISGVTRLLTNPAADNC
jgi:hypothetical protein